MFITSNKVTYPVYKQKSVLDNNKSNTKKVIASTATIIGVAACVKNKKTLVKIVKNKISEIKKLLCKNSKNKYPTVYSIKPEIKKTLKDILDDYLKTVKNGEIDPARLDEILTKYVGKKNVQELKFYPAFEKGITNGRKKIYRLPTGEVMILECHTSKHGTVTRLYDNIANKNSRSYLYPNGNFYENAFTSPVAHLKAGALGNKWISSKLDMVA